MSFENYKSFKDPVEIKLNRINYLIGPNGAGKSNVLAGIQTISNIIRGNAIPPQEDCFDRLENAPIRFSVTIELDEDERRMLLKKVSRYSEGAVDFSTNKIFQYLKYSMSFTDGQETVKKIQLSDAHGELQIVQELSFVNGLWQMRSCHISGVDLENMRKLYLDTQNSNNIPQLKFLNTFDPDMAELVVSWFYLNQTTNHREFQGRVEARRDEGVSPNGQNLPNQINTMYDERSQIQNFENKMRTLSSGEIVEVHTRMADKYNVLELRELGRTSATVYDEISDGHRQGLILQHFLHRYEKSIVVMEDPELHLHANAQKKLLKAIRESVGDSQVIIATHSPIFANVSGIESTFLLSKHDGGTVAVPIDSSNVNLIKTSMGISQADVFGSDYLCCVEGESEDIAIPAFARSLGYEVSLTQWTWNVKGFGNVKHIGPLIRYLEKSGKRIFILLDKNGEASKHVDYLVRKNTSMPIPHHFLEANFEDLFPSSTLVKHSRQLAQERGVEFELSAKDLEKRRQDESAIDVLQKEWKSHTDREYPKVCLAKRLASLKRDEIPEKVKDLIDKIMGELGVNHA